MNCQKVEEVASEIVRGQMMEADVRRDALAHCDICESCSERLTNERWLSRALQALSAQMEEMDAPASVQSELLKTFRAEKQAVGETVVSRSSKRYWIAAAAAVLVVLSSIVALRLKQAALRQPDQLITQTDKSTQDAAPQTETSPKRTEQPAALQNTQSKPRKRHVAPSRVSERSETAVANHAREIMTDFIPLSYSNGMNLQDGGQIVRVELPRSALVTFGLPVNMDRLNEKVKADVWLGVDGMAHAIRFVQPDLSGQLPAERKER